MAYNPNAHVLFKDLRDYDRITAGIDSGVVELNRVNGEYENVADYFFSIRNGEVYTVKAPLQSYSTESACIKDDANAGLVCVPSTNASAGRDDYRNISPFVVKECNGYVDANGRGHVTAIKNDAFFERDGSSGNVWMVAPVLYVRYTATATHLVVSISDTRHAGFDPQPGAKLPDGTIRPFMMYAKYAGSKYDGKLASVSGQPLWNRTVSQNSMVDAKNALGQGYSAKTHADDWYVKTMFLMKYGTKRNEGVMTGCVGYIPSVHPSVQETGVNRVIMANSDADKFLVGSSVMLGSASSDRKASTAYDVFDARRIVKIESYDAGNKAVYVEGAAFDTAASQYLTSAPWHSGSCDNVQGNDGSPTSCTSCNEPFAIQGIECMVGAYEVIGNVIMDARADDAGNLFEDVYLCYDSSKQAKSLTSDYVKVGALPIADSDGWSYAYDFEDCGGLLVPKGTGATSTTGLGDAVYQNVSTSMGQREWRGVGSLVNGGMAGVWCVDGDNWLTYANWNIASRLSATGRTAA